MSKNGPVKKAFRNFARIAFKNQQIPKQQFQDYKDCYYTGFLDCFAMIISLPKFSPEAFEKLFGDIKIDLGKYAEEIREKKRESGYDPDYETRCEVCGNVPTVRSIDDNGDVDVHTGMCGPCTFGTAECLDPENW